MGSYEPVWAHMGPARAHEVRETILKIDSNLENCSMVESLERISQSNKIPTAIYIYIYILGLPRSLTAVGAVARSYDRRRPGRGRAVRCRTKSEVVRSDFEKRRGRAVTMTSHFCSDGLSRKQAYSGSDLWPFQSERRSAGRS